MTTFFTILFGIAVLAACVISNQLGQRHRQRSDAHSAASKSGWWDNGTRTPLSPAEAREIANQAAWFYRQWLADPDVSHGWLCIDLKADRMVCKAIHRTPTQPPPAAPSFNYPHAITCQADREELAEHILWCIRKDDPDCRLYLDGDALILPTNLDSL